MSARKEGENSDEEYEILDLTNRGKSSFDTTMDRIFGDVTKSSAVKQLAVGGGTGWLAGFLCVKVGKAAAITLGATALAFQVASYNGLITVNWTKVNRIVDEVSVHARKRIQKSKSMYFEQAKEFYRENVFLAVGFSGGFLTGFFF